MFRVLQMNPAKRMPFRVCGHSSLDEGKPALEARSGRQLLGMFMDKMCINPSNSVGSSADRLWLSLDPVREQAVALDTIRWDSI
mmetsp:Transcript_21581/g.50597  ORF Transcript_21581/g.50597 Transcript_21581/m.50597 type:complete len:84 (+) Transcript_21581:153-404(+)